MIRRQRSTRGPAAASRAVALLVLGLIVGAAMVTSAAGKAGKDEPSDLPEHWRVWLDEEVYPLISKEQRRAFLSLDTEAQRSAFAERLWILWGRRAGLGSAFRQIYNERLEFCRVEFGNTFEDRARALLIHGPPAIRYRGRCSEFFVPLEIWVWPYIEGLGENVTVLFYQVAGVGWYKMWYAIEGRNPLLNMMPGADSSGRARFGSNSPLDDPRFRCPDGDTLMNLMAAAEFWGRDPAVLQAMTQYGDPERGGPESSSRRFMEFSALLDKDAEPLPFTVKEDSWGTRGGLVHVGFAIDVPSDGLGTTDVGDVGVVQLDVIGEISRVDQMVDRFRYVFSVPASDEDLGLLIERFIRPGDYTLRLKVEDVHSDRASVAEQRFTASVEPTATPPFAVDDDIGLDEVATAEVVDLGGGPGSQPLLRLAGPEGEAISGVHRFEALTRDEVARVTFIVNGEEILTKNRPPFDVDLDLGPLPRLTTVTAIGYDGGGNEIARERLSVNVGRERFYLEIKPLSPTTDDQGRTRVAVDVNLPTEARLASLELFWNDFLLASLSSPPYETWVRLEGGGQFGYLRAVATMADGSMAEDIQFVNAPEFGTVVDVTAVELPVTVLDRSSGKPVENLTQDDFRVFEDGVEQTISHFSLHRDLPVRLGIVVDTSGSMEDTLPTVQKVVMGFLRDLLRPRDRAFIETFSDQPDVLATFTADFATLENALLALFADRSTALYDAMVMGLFQFSGVRGRKAMVVLTDGDDTASKSSFEDVMGYAQRSGVTVYAIGVDLPATKVVSRWQLGKLAETTGGQAFFVSERSELDRIYDEIDRELRTQYLLAYTSSSDKPSDQLRKIDVEVDRRRVRVRTLSGYYPGGI